jgi:periplasmic divalent cation tolerance protein
LKAKKMKLVITTLPSETSANEISQYLVSQSLAACVNIIKGVTSVYHWEGEIKLDNECMLMIKTTAGKLEELKQALDLKHPYQIYEFVVFEPEHVDEKYKKWVEDSLC